MWIKVLGGGGMSEGGDRPSIDSHILRPPSLLFIHIYIHKYINKQIYIYLYIYIYTFIYFYLTVQGFPDGSDGQESACNAGDPSSIPESGRSPGEGNGNPLQYSCLENSMDRGAWQATVHGVAKSQTRLSDQHAHTQRKRGKFATFQVLVWTEAGSRVELRLQTDNF